MTATAHDWIQQFLFGALFGALGQGIRVIVGMKKINDAALRSGQTFADVFSPGTLVVSLLIGAIAGVLGTLTAKIDLQALTRDNVVLLIGIGYAGADFIEGFVRKELPANGAATDASAAAPGAVAEPDASPAPPVG